jgi:hypothetical protein
MGYGLYTNIFLISTPFFKGEYLKNQTFLDFLRGGGAKEAKFSFKSNLTLFNPSVPTSSGTPPLENKGRKF